MAAVRARFPLGYIADVCMPSSGVWRMHAKCLVEFLNEMIVDCYDELSKEAKLGPMVMVASQAWNWSVDGLTQIQSNGESPECKV
jgi:hypothetical protein